MPAELSSRLGAQCPHLIRGIKCNAAPNGCAVRVCDKHKDMFTAHLGVCRSTQLKQDMPAELSSRWNTKGKRKVVLQKDHVPDCKTETQTLRRWFLKKRPVINPRVGPLGTTGRLSFLKSRHLFGSHTKTLRPIVSQTGPCNLSKIKCTVCILS